MQLKLPAGFSMGSGTTSVTSEASGLGKAQIQGSFSSSAGGSPVVLTITRGNDGAATNGGELHGLIITNIQNAASTGTAFQFEVCERQHTTTRIEAPHRRAFLVTNPWKGI